MAVRKMDAISIVADRVHLYDVQRNRLGMRKHWQFVGELLLAIGSLGAGFVDRFHSFVDAICTSAIVSQSPIRQFLLGVVAPADQQTAVVSLLQMDRMESRCGVRCFIGH